MTDQDALNSGEFDDFSSPDVGGAGGGGQAQHTPGDGGGGGAGGGSAEMELTVQILQGALTGKGTPNAHVSYSILTTVRSPQGGLPRQFRISRRFSHFVKLHEQVGSGGTGVAGSVSSVWWPHCVCFVIALFSDNFIWVSGGQCGVVNVAPGHKTVPARWVPCSLL